MTSYVARVGYSSESNRRKTVGITLPNNLVKKARKHKLNISKISEQALTSIIAYLEGYVDDRSESPSRVWCSGLDNRLRLYSRLQETSRHSCYLTRTTLRLML